MSNCQLRISGPFLLVSEVIKSSSIPLVESSFCASERRRGRILDHEPTTFHLAVSEADGEHVPVQVREAELFVRNNLKDLSRILTTEGVMGGVLDFGWDVPEKQLGPWTSFPVSLLHACAEAGLGINVSVYVVDGYAQEPNQ